MAHFVCNDSYILNMIHYKLQNTNNLKMNNQRQHLLHYTTPSKPMRGASLAAVRGHTLWWPLGDTVEMQCVSTRLTCQPPTTTTLGNQ
jgi:hypothetical protein